MIEVRGAHKELGEFSLRGVDLRIETGEYFIVLGPTGAGKTVLLECIAGLHQLDSGEVWLEDRDVTHLPTEHRNVGYVPQDYVLFPHMSLRRNIQFSLELVGTGAEVMDARVNELAAILRIGHLLDRRPRTLSGGEQQRGALARALAPRPTVLLLDEPLSALDEGTRAELTSLLAGVSHELGTTVIHVCHNFDEALELADRIAIMRQGEILQVGPPAEVFRRPGSEFLARFVGAQNLLPVISVDEATRTVVLGESVFVSAEHVPSPVPPDVLATIRPEEIAVARTATAPGAPGLNRIPCTVSRVEDRGRNMRVHLAGAVPLLAVITPQAFRESGVSEGDAVTASFTSAAVHLIAR
jgi:ABC-type sugar transport system ATPase subunit